MINNVILMGRLVASPETHKTNAGNTVTRFRLAIDRDFVKEGEERKADFIPCIAWRQTADFIDKYFVKGSLIAVQGAIQSENYKDKEGNNRTAYEVLVTRASFCGEKKAEGQATVDVSEDDFENEDGLPF